MTLGQPGLLEKTRHGLASLPWGGECVKSRTATSSMRQGFIAFPSRKYREIERGFISTDREEMTSPDVFENAAVKHNVPSGPSYNKSEKRLQEKARVHHYNSKI